MTKVLDTFHTILRVGRGPIWALALMALLSVVIGVASPTLLRAQSEPTLNLGSLSITDENGTAIDFGTLDPAVLTYSANVASTVESVTVTARPQSNSGVHVNLTPSDYGPGDRVWEVEGREVSLNHGRNLILIGVYSYSVDEPLRVYTIEINRAGSAPEGEENLIRSNSLEKAREGTALPFLLTRSGDVSAALTVPVDVWSTDNTSRTYVIPNIDPVTILERVEVEFQAGSASAVMNHETTDDSLYAGGYYLGVTLVAGTGYRVPSFSGSGRFASTLVWDDDYNEPNLESLGVTDQNGASVAIGEFDPDLTSYSGSVGSGVTHVTVTQSTTERSRFAARVLPPDSEPDLDGHQVALQHGANLISVILMASFYDAVNSGTYDVIVTRAGSPSGTPTPSVSVYGLSDAIEGYAMPFILARSGDTSQSLTVTANVSETGGDVVPQTSEGSYEVVFPAGSASARVEVPTVADQDWEEHSTVTVAVVAGTGYELSPEAGSASSTVKDNDVPEVTAAFTVDPSPPQEGDVITATVTVATDGPKQPHGYIGNLDFSVELGSAQEEDLRIPFDSNYRRNFPDGHRITGGSHSRSEDGKSGAFFVNQQALKPVEADGVITHYQYQFSVPILIVDDERAEADETFDISVEWDSYSRRTATMDEGITSRTVTIQEHDDTPSTPDPVSHITVAIANFGSAGSTYTVSWHDTGECTSRYGYGVYLTKELEDGWTQWHTLGIAGRDETQLVKTLDTVPLRGQSIVKVTCGDIGLLIGEVPLPSATEDSVERPVPGTYSSQPALTSLTVSPGTLGPAFNNYGFLYSVLDVPNSDSQVTLSATARSGYSISWDPSEDADPDTDGHQVDLPERYNSVFISVDHDLGIHRFTYEVIVKRTGPISLQQQENSPATGGPTISGTAEVGQTLTADTSGISDTDGLTNVSYSYQWIRNDGGTDTDISGQTGSTYTLVSADEGKTIKVRVSFTDDAGNDEALTSAETAVVSATAPGSPGSVDVQPSGTGTLEVTWQAPASIGGSSITGYTIQWKLASGSWDTPADVSEAMATGTTHTITNLELDVEYAVRVIATNSAGDGPTSAESTATPVAESSEQQLATQNSPASGQPAVSGDMWVGETLTVDTSSVADSDGLTNASFSYQWISNDGTADADIQDATGASYTLVAADQGKTIKARVSFTDDAGNDETVTSAATTEVEAALTAELRRVPDSHSGSGTFTFRILFSEPVEVTFRTLKNHSFEVSNGTIQRAQRVDGRNDLRKITVQPSSSAAVALVLPTTLDCAAEGAVCTSDGKPLSSRLELTVPGPEPSNSAAQGAPTISGTAQVNETLTAGTSGITDANGLDNASFSYQWIRVNTDSTETDISGATGGTHTLVAADQGKTIKVRVSFTDDASNAETLTSAATAAVSAAPPTNTAASGAPVITGTAQVGQTLTAGTSGITDANGLDNASFSYQWIRVNTDSTETDISGATGGTHTLVAADQGKTIKVRVSFTDDASNAETLTSAATAAVSAAPLTNTAASGAPVITGTAQVGQTLTAGTSGITDANGLDNALFAYQWLRDDTAIAGATSSTYVVAGADEGHAIKVRVSFTDDDDFSESLTSSGLDIPVVPLEGHFDAATVPASHGGLNSTFTFQLYFSVEPTLGFVNVRDNVLTLTNGDITKVRRTDRESTTPNTRWEITVQPTGAGAVTIALSPTTDCSADSAVCTTWGKMLSNSASITVAGP